MPSKLDIKRMIRPHMDKKAGGIVPGIPAADVALNFVELLHKHTGRNVIVYYSCFPRKNHNGSGVEELDITGFMLAMQDLDPSKGVDLIMQTPGGDPRAAEGIVEYLQATFHGDIRVIVPYCAYSAGTLISCAAKTIVLGKHSFLGPVDPQLGSIPCLNIMQEFDEAREDIIANPNAVVYWDMRLKEYYPGIYKQCRDAVNLGDELVSTWLTKYMFAGESGPEVEAKVERIRAKLNSNNHSHGRHFGYEFCKELGLKVEALEDDPELQYLILGLHHALEFTIADHNLAKFITSQTGEIYAIAGEKPVQKKKQDQAKKAEKAEKPGKESK